MYLKGNKFPTKKRSKFGTNKPYSLPKAATYITDNFPCFSGGKLHVINFLLTIVVVGNNTTNFTSNSATNRHIVHTYIGVKCSKKMDKFNIGWVVQENGPFCL